MNYTICLGVRDVADRFQDDMNKQNVSVFNFVIEKLGLHL